MWRLYYALLSAVSPIARIAFRWHSKAFTIRRVRVAIMRPDGQVLLVQNAVGDRKWTLPGGGASRIETDAVAACREVYEELKIRIDSAELQLLGDVQSRGYVTPVFVVRIDQLRAERVTPQRLEIKSWRWASLQDLPLEVQSTVYSVRDLLSHAERVDRIEG